MKKYLKFRVQPLLSSCIAVLGFLSFGLAAQGSTPLLSGGQYASSSATFLFAADSGTPSSTWHVYKSTDLRFWTPLADVQLDSTGHGLISDSEAGVSHNFYVLGDGSDYTRVIGFARMEVRGGSYKMIANQLEHDNGNGISVALIDTPASAPDGINNAVLYFWQGGAYYHYSFFNAADAAMYIGPGSPAGWYDLANGNLQNQALDPGMGAFIYNPQSSGFMLTLIGLVPSSPHTLSVSLGYNLLSLVIPVSADLNEVGFPGVSDQNGWYNDILYLWTDGGFYPYEYYTAAHATIFMGQPADAGWYEASGTFLATRVQVGTGFYIYRSVPGSSWTQTYFLP
jgi:hypothetical protein